MNGAESLVHTLVGGGVEVCFANPGTSEMHFVAALDRVDGMRCVLGLFEGVVTGAADGYYRMSDKAAATLLHLGPGLVNGLANIHNANRAMSGMVNIVGDHATYHRQYDAPLASDIDWVGLAKSLGVPGARVADMDGFNRRFAEGLATPAPISPRSFSRSRSTVRRKSRLLRPVCGQTGRSAVPTGAPKIIHFAIPWWPLLTQLNRYRCRLRAAALGLLTPSRRPS